MHNLDVVTALWFLSDCMTVAAIWRFARSHLHRTYPWFFGNLLFVVALDTVGMAAGYNTSWYCYFYWSMQPFLTIVHVFVVFELFADLYASYEGLRVIARKALWFCVGVSALIAALSLPTVLHSTWRCQAFRCLLFAVLEVKRFAETGLILFTPMFLYHLFRLRIRLGRNTVLHATCYNALLLANVATGIITFLSRSSRNSANNYYANVVFMLIATVCYSGWAFGMDFRKIVGRSSIDLDEVATLTKRLDALTDVLSKTSRTIY